MGVAGSTLGSTGASEMIRKGQRLPTFRKREKVLRDKREKKRNGESEREKEIESESRH